MREARELVVFDFNNPKQAQFHDTVMLSIARRLAFRTFFYGGAIRGGKTFVCLFIFITLARLFPRSRWHVFRSSFPELEDTTIPSAEKLLGPEGKDFVWKRRQSNYHIRFSNGSKIFFKSEKLQDDPELKWMLGLETNGILLEQLEGLSEKLLDRSFERVGSWYIPDMPPPIILGTFNPTNNWVKKKIYDLWQENKLPATWYFQEALPSDNPHVTQEQWENWENLDPISKDQLIRGIWRFLADAKLFAYAFDRVKTVVDVNTEQGAAFMQPVRTLPIKVIFDFNHDPITAIVVQNDGLRWGKVLKEYRLRTSDIYELCRQIKADWAGYYIIATGDATGRGKTAITKGNKTYLDIIKQELNLSVNQMKFPSKNPSVKNTRVLLNSVLFRHQAFYIASSCIWLLNDLENVKVDDEGDIDKKTDGLITHLLDCLRYFMWNFWRGFVRF